MMGRKQHLEPQLFYPGFCLNQRIGIDNRYRRICQAVDFDFVRPAVEHLYGDVGNPSVDPIVVLKLMIIAFVENITSERELIRRLPERLDWLWFCQFDLDSKLPDHSVPSKARRRWGVELFKLFFGRILTQCMEAGLVDGQTIHIDSSMIQGNVSSDSLQPAFAVLAKQKFEQLEANCDIPQEASVVVSKIKDDIKLSPTDLDARCRTKPSEHVTGYQEHRVVDDAYGVITASETTDAAVGEGTLLATMVEQHEANTDSKPAHVVADKAYGTACNYTYLHNKGQLPCIPHMVQGRQKGMFAVGEFKYDRERDCYICPAGKMLTLYRVDRQRNRRRYRIPDAGVCLGCKLRGKCTECKHGRTVNRLINQDIVDWADSCMSTNRRRELMRRRKCCVEGSFADAANNHGFKRTRWRGRWRVKIGNLLIATIQNLRKLLKYSRKLTQTAVMALSGAVLPQTSTVILPNRALLLTSRALLPL